MIRLIRLKLRNFMSFGNHFSTIDFTNPLTLVMGNNGAGKSAAITEGVCFALFNKPYRKINKTALVNMTNKTNCQVILEFSIDGDGLYRIERGIAPNSFLLYKDDVLINQSANNKDYQVYLENEIIRMSYITFTQIIMIGKSSFTPFLRLTAADKRKFIDKVMNLWIFGEMQGILKDDITAHNAIISKLENAITLNKEKLKLQDKHLQNLKTITPNDDSQLNELKAQLKDLLVKLNAKPDTEAMNDLSKKIDHLKTSKIKVEMAIKDTQKNIDYLSSHDNCSLCHQEITETAKIPLIEKFSGELVKYTDLQQKVTDTLKVDNAELLKLTTAQMEYEKCYQQARLIKSNIEALNKSKTVVSTDNILSDLQENISEIQSNLLTLQEEYKAALQVKYNFDIVYDLLKSGVVKNSILSNCRNVLQTITMKYLALMGFKGKIQFDDDFTEVITLKNVERGYNTFSEGEKMRIDLSIMLAWREIVRVYNKGHEINVLIFDEILDSSLDTNGVQMLIDIMQKLTGFNKVLISHSMQWAEYFDYTLHFTQINGFSQIKVI